MNSNPQLTKNLIQASFIGAVIPLIYILFIIATKEDVFEKWMLIPLLLIPLGGGLGGTFFYLIGFKWIPEGRKRLLAIIFGTLIYFLSLWLSAVMAFNLTGHWN